ncbi:hypothetical protein N752_16385 [Desulforamulus aquiferis]|nr:hypothetical protein [Desulforamulus aquiferis]RYD04155.1 hypothetical protein N752_16385 [Desulforamulus aquiferis]
MNSNIKNRDEIEDIYKWNTANLYKDSEEAAKDMQFIRDLLEKFHGLSGKLSNKETILEALLLQDTLDQLMEKCYTYAHMKLDEDNANTASLALFDQVKSLFVTYSEMTSYFIPELMKIDYTLLEEYSKAEDFQDYRHFIKEIGRNKEHILSDPEEKILSSFSELTGAPKSIFQILNNADLKLGISKMKITNQ